MESSYFLPIASSVIVLMLGIIGWFLIRFVKQYDEANENHGVMFDKLLKKFDTLTEIIYEHKTDVAIIKSEIYLVKNLTERVRVVENDITILKERRVH